MLLHEVRRLTKQGWKPRMYLQYCIAVPLWDFIPTWFLFSICNQKRRLRKHITFLKFVTLIQTRASSRCTAGTPGGTIVRYKTTEWLKRVKPFMILDVGNHLKGRKQNRRVFSSQKKNQNPLQNNKQPAVINSCSRSWCYFVGSFFREMLTKTCKARFNSTMRGGINIVYEWRQNWFQQGNLPSSKWNCFLLILYSKDYEE